MIGLKRGEVILENHDPLWHIKANEIISLLKEVFNKEDFIIEHIGSTAISNLKAKPIIDLALAVSDLNELNPYLEALAAKGIIDRGSDISGQRLFVMGDFNKDTRTCHIHVVLKDSKAWQNYLRFRDVLNQDESLRKEYEDLKTKLAEAYPHDRKNYTKQKDAFIQSVLEG